jgi:hypothetical protein
VPLFDCSYSSTRSSSTLGSSSSSSSRNGGRPRPPPGLPRRARPAIRAPCPARPRCYCSSGDLEAPRCDALLLLPSSLCQHVAPSSTRSAVDLRDSLTSTTACRAGCASGRRGRGWPCVAAGACESRASGREVDQWQRRIGGAEPMAEADRRRWTSRG